LGKAVAKLMTRRQAVLASIATLATPAISRGQGTRVLKFVPRTGLALLDPVWTTETATRAFALSVFESLYSVDEKLVAHPQMAAGHMVEDDGSRWVIRLRDGLRFHDGEPVLARDCVASIGRWMKRDAVGRTLALRLDALEAPDDHTIVFRLNKPFPQLPFTLGKAQPNMLPVMPARLASTDPSQQMSELIGSGPFRFVPGEFSAGSFAVMARFDGYVPRDEAPNGTSGGRKALLDRVEWHAIPDPATAAGALLTGEMDWVETPLPDLLSQLRRNRDIVVDICDPHGNYPLLRPNHVSGPTANVGVRRAIMAALDPAEIIHAVTGDEPGTATAPVGCFLPGSASDSRTGMERLGPKDPAVVKAMLREAGYANERLVLLHAADFAPVNAMFQVIAVRLAEAGFNVDDQVMDQVTVVTRRNNREAPDKGGWSLLIANAPAADHLSPMVALGLRTGAAAWIGWPNDPSVEELRVRWIDSADPDEQKRLAVEIQGIALSDVLYVPLGHYLQKSAWRSNVSGVLKASAPIFWNVAKT
jgi:peptide/nickel transport system substrate-binding protein